MLPQRLSSFSFSPSLVSTKLKLQLQRENQIMANVVELKVGLHCDECIKKILKAVKKIEDIETYDVDTQLNKITVTGKVTTEEVMKALQKIGKQSTIWEKVASYNLQ